jgi:hypothetical protein
VPLAASRGQEAGGAKWRSRRACGGGRGGEKGAGDVDGALLKGSDGKQGKEGGSRVDVRVEEGEGRRGGPGTAAGGAGRPAPARSQRAAVLRQGRPGMPTGGPGASVTGGTVKTV